MSQQDTESGNFGPGSDDPLAPGERQREGYKIFALHKELGFSDLPSVIGQDVSDSEFETSSARRWHTFGGRRIESPQGGDTAGHPLREHLAHRCQDTEAQAFEADVLWLGKISATFRPRMAQ